VTESYVGAYWGAREYGLERSAALVVELVRRLAEYDPVLTGWRDPGDTKAQALANPVVTLNEQEMMERLLAGRHRRDMTGEIFDDLGYSVFWWNGRTDKKTAAKLSIGIDRLSPLVSNSAVLHLPDSAFAPNIYHRDVALGILTTVIDIFAPDHARWTDWGLMTPQKEPDQPLEGGGYRLGDLVGVPAGWASFLRDGIEPQFDEAKLPPCSIRRIGGGTLVVVGDDPAAAPLADVLAVRRAMGYTVPGDEPEQRGLAGAPMTAPTFTPPSVGLQAPESSRSAAAESKPPANQAGTEPSTATPAKGRSGDESGPKTAAN
jgi:hypothetical protein